MISMPNEAVSDGPHVIWKHIDGPLLMWAGGMHWLTWRQRLRIFFGLATVDQIACEMWPRLAELRDKIVQARAYLEVVPYRGSLDLGTLVAGITDENRHDVMP